MRPGKRPREPHLGQVDQVQLRQIMPRAVRIERVEPQQHVAPMKVRMVHAGAMSRGAQARQGQADPQAKPGLLARRQFGQTFVGVSLDRAGVGNRLADEIAIAHQAAAIVFSQRDRRHGRYFAAAHLQGVAPFSPRGTSAQQMRGGVQERQHPVVLQIKRAMG
jgi:hypothetical protein